MINRRQRELAARNKFSFTDPGDEVAFKTWAEGMEGRYSNFRKPGGGAWSRKAHHNEDGDDSSVPSPKLWEQAERNSAIAGYRQEMMELVRDVPDTAYELSLKDMVVELPRIGKEEVEVRKVARKGVERRISRKESMDAGFLLKMSLPFYFGGKKKKGEGSHGGSTGGSKVSPKPVSSRTDGGRSSSNGSSDSSSSGGGSRSSNHVGCFSFFMGLKSRIKWP